MPDTKPEKNKSRKDRKETELISDKILKGIGKIIKNDPNYQLPVAVENNENVLKIGELTLSSSVYDIDHLCDLALFMLQQESVKEYLNIIRKNQFKPSYTD